MSITAAINQLAGIIATVPGVSVYVEREPVAISPDVSAVIYDSRAFSIEVIDNATRIWLNCSSEWIVRIADTNDSPVNDLLDLIESIINVLDPSLHDSVPGPLCSITTESVTTRVRESGSNYVDGVISINFSLYIQRQTS